ncbi:uncharacterized protein LOC125422338 [Ziziphus jujuba]|uniref:Uncharacterized protein LOC125422338 n=2 Tax=Ziziphus jujuba TaxID=326968 RepID=A0ABM3IJC8_ZIZJJ|nr:uncharacterized protein LOC125422338 [Ziziphus jujuba]KAH7528035.1 hypothetical protein FEM48_Zijuj05G0029100 [Ziziphus jujuba var. spinosa]
MAGLLISNPSSFTLPLPSPPPTQQPSIKPPHSVFFPVVRFSGDPICRKTRGRGLTVVTRAGPGTSSYIFAFVLPLSLLAITVFTSIRIADKLDEDFLEEVAINQAIMEEDEEANDIDLPLEEQPTRSRARNRPKREI